MEPNIDTRDTFPISQIGVVKREDGRVLLSIATAYRTGLVGLDRFSHAQVLWWFDRCADEKSRRTVQVDPPFPAPTLGVFALKAPTRPNPIALSTVRILSVDPAAGTMEVPAIDAFDGTPILDIKPYVPSFDRVNAPRVPEWASGWPDSLPEDGIPLDQIPDEAG